MEVVHVTKKGKMMDTVGFHIYKETKASNQINDRLKVREKAIFETTVQEDPYRGAQLHRSPTAEKNSVVRSHSSLQEVKATKGEKPIHSHRKLSNITLHTYAHRNPQNCYDKHKMIRFRTYRTKTRRKAITGTKLLLDRHPHPIHRKLKSKRTENPRRT